VATGMREHQLVGHCSDDDPRDLHSAHLGTHLAAISAGPEVISRVALRRRSAGRSRLPSSAAAS
jgi:hypothetical protein